MTRSLLIVLTLPSLVACNEVATLGNGMDSEGSGGNAGAIGDGGESGTMATGGASAGRGGTSSDAGRGGDMPEPPLGGRGGVGSGGSSAGSGAEAGCGEFGMGAMCMGATAGTGGCRVSTMDTNQGLPPPPAEDCTDIGAALKEAHDAALESLVLDVVPLAGTWVDGSGQARVELVLDATGAGTLRFGEASEFPEVSGSDPAFLTTTGERDASKVFDLSHLRKQPGFGYTVIADNGRGSEMSFHILAAEAWEEWCALQTPVKSPLSRSCYACTDDEGLYSFFDGCGTRTGCFASDRDADEAKRVHCGRYELCVMPHQNVCNCTADECFAHLQIQGQLNYYPFEVTLDPVDQTVLRLRSHSGIQADTTYYLGKQE